MWLQTFTVMVSPQLASIKGAGNAPLIRRALLFTPSGAIVPLAMLKLYVGPLPVERFSMRQMCWDECDLPETGPAV